MLTLSHLMWFICRTDEPNLRDISLSNFGDLREGLASEVSSGVCLNCGKDSHLNTREETLFEAIIISIMMWTFSLFKGFYQQSIFVCSLLDFKIREKLLNLFHFRMNFKSELFIKTDQLRTTIWASHS